MKEKIIQVFNADQQPFFVGMESGKTSWTITTKQLPQLTFVGHLTDGDACYYEDLRTQEVTWAIPFTELVKISSATLNAVCKGKSGANSNNLSLGTTINVSTIDSNFSKP